MKSSSTGIDTSEAEVQSISRHGIWLFVRRREFFLPFDQFPWFQEAPVGKILNVELLHGEHLHWPDLDVDLHLDSLQYPANYPLTYR